VEVNDYTENAFWPFHDITSIGKWETAARCSRETWETHKQLAVAVEANITLTSNETNMVKLSGIRVVQVSFPKKKLLSIPNVEWFLNPKMFTKLQLFWQSRLTDLSHPIAILYEKQETFPIQFGTLRRWR
jgi:hypothetical protein